MKIACLGWGSLIWKPENLLIRREWFQDGHILPIEFTRQSKDGRLTLVITPNASQVRTLWAIMATTNLNDAKISLQIREGIGEKRLEMSIGSISKEVQNENENPTNQLIRTWMGHMSLDAVIWTNLSPKFNNEDGRIPTKQEAITYLEGLDINKRDHAEQYIRTAPRQIDTDFRRDFEKRWNWTSLK